MSAVPRSGSSRINSNPVRSYISMRKYNNDIFSYTVSEVDFNNKYFIYKKMTRKRKSSKINKTRKYNG
jgi:hypothetical protein